ncbi:MAG: MFS transporter [bacterium]|nr:MFS transporter [bacterium]
MKDHSTVFRKDVLGWSLYDFANTIYSMNIVSLYLKRYIVEDLGYGHAWFDIPFSISMLLSAILLPALGALSDHATKKKMFLFLFTLTCCIAVAGMAIVPHSALTLVVILFILANFAYEAGQPFYNALLYSVADGPQARFVSGIGVAVGYIGSSLGVLMILPFVTGDLFGIQIPLISGWGKTGSFVPTAMLFMLFSVPLFLWVREKEVEKKSRLDFKQAYREVWDGLRQTKKYPGVLRFLIADYFFEDAAATVILNIGIYCSVVLGMEESSITIFMAVSATAAVAGSFLIGKLSENRSLKKMLGAVVVGWTLALIAFVATNNNAMVWLLGSLVGILLGGLWTTSRPMLAELVPREELGRFFGLFALSGRAAAIVGPLLWTLFILLFSPKSSLGRWVGETWNLSAEAAVELPYKLGILSLAVMMLIGLFIFRKVPHTSGTQSGL